MDLILLWVLMKLNKVGLIQLEFKYSNESKENVIKS